MADQVYYEKPVLLDRDKHRRRRVKGSSSFAFARKANSLYLAGVETRDAAEALVGRYLEAPARGLPDGSFYWDQLIGLEVRDPRGEPIGELVEIFRAGGNEVYRVVGPRGERLVPALRSAVVEIDLERGRMTVADDDADEVR